jgi:hypothetical protein
VIKIDDSFIRGNLNALDEVYVFLAELSASHGKGTVTQELIELLGEKINREIAYYEKLRDLTK